MTKKAAIIGAGPMGLTVAYQLLKEGWQVDVFEKGDKIGGMSVHFDFSGLSIEKFYHFVCGPDDYTFDILKELNIYDKLKWNETKMGFFYQGKLYPWGGPFELLFFPKASIFEKARYGLHVFLATKRKNWQALDDTTAIDWLNRWLGEKGYKKYWDSLFRLKFYDYKTKIAAPWLWSRLARVGKSRRNLFTEKMGYIEGGSETFLAAIEEAITSLGGKIYKKSPVEQVLFKNSAASGIRVGGKDKSYDYVVSTMPIQYLPGIAPDMPKSDLEKLKQLDNVGVVCVCVKLKSAFTQNFWLNITDDEIDTPGMIELSNLNTELPSHVLYVPFYLHKNSEKYTRSEAEFTEETKQYLKRLQPDFDLNDILDMRAFKYEYAQPVCTPGFLDKLPPIASDERKGFFVSDTAYCYPEDRSINESVKAAYEIVKQMKEQDEA